VRQAASPIYNSNVKYLLGIGGTSESNGISSLNLKSTHRIADVSSRSAFAFLKSMNVVDLLPFFEVIMLLKALPEKYA
jgi:hypothetical protein